MAWNRQKSHLYLVGGDREQILGSQSHMCEATKRRCTVLGLVYNSLYLKIHTFIYLRKHTFFLCSPPAIAFAFLDSIDLAKKCQKGWGVRTKMAVISTRQGQKPINNFYGPVILLFMDNLYNDALNASVTTLGVMIVEGICRCLDPQDWIPPSPSCFCIFPVVNLCVLKTVTTTPLTRTVFAV